jgi:hypothetical protein
MPLRRHVDKRTRVELDDLFPEERSKGQADADAKRAAGTVS